MDKGIIPREFYIGRYIYLTGKLENLPKASFVHDGGKVLISILTTEQKTGERKRRRISQKNAEWEEYNKSALIRSHLEDQLNKTLANWSQDYQGSLLSISCHYELRPDCSSVYNSEMWDSFKDNECSKEKSRMIYHNCVEMRSQFEADAAEILDNLGIDYKYDICLTTESNGSLYPDFAMNFPEFNRCGFLELLGLLDRNVYVNDNAYKFKRYINSGIYPNRDIAFVSADDKYRPDHDTVKRIIGVIIDSFARQCVIRKL